MNKITGLVAVLLVLRMIAEGSLILLNCRHVANHAKTIPDIFKGKISEETYPKSVAYTLAKNQFSMIETFVGSILTALFLFSNVLPMLFSLMSSFLGDFMLAQPMILISMVIMMSVPLWPLEYWEQFHLEEQFGFNKSTKKLWVSDKIKGILLGFLLGVPILGGLLGILTALPATWWIWGSLFILAIQLLLLILYPRLILPLFNKLSPLEQGSLRDRLMALSQRTGFKASTIEVMDGSKRSGHSNAFFTGFGRFRRIVLFDTLIKELSEEEIEAVLAHEIGHYKLGHVPKMIAMSGCFIFASLFMVYWLIGQPSFYESFGFSPQSGFVPAFILFSILSGLVTFWFKPLLNRISRKHEYQADAFAKQALGSGAPLIQSLIKLHEKNLSNLTPHPLYSAVHYSHPTLLERVKLL